MALIRIALTILLLSLLTLVSTIQPPREPYQSVGRGKHLLTFEKTTPSATIKPTRNSFHWVNSGIDGMYLNTSLNGDILLCNVATGMSDILVAADHLPHDLEEYWANHNASLLLVATNATKQYRYSYLADYFIVDVESREMDPLVEDQAGDIQYAEFAPRGDVIAFVRRNNLFILNLKSENISQITKDGGPDVLHGVPDWVYEEEVFRRRSALWFSPDAEYLTFLSFNETGVNTVTIPNYMGKQNLAPTYPKEVKVHYPKVGSANPTVQLNILTLSSGKYKTVPVDGFAPDDLIIGEVSWMTDTHTALIYRAFNRIQDVDAHVIVNPVSLTSKTVRERDGSDGWLENNLAIKYVGKLRNGSNDTYYVDLSDEDGWNHIYLYPIDKGEEIQLTKGEWEVDSILRVNTDDGNIYFQAAKRHSTERHIYKVSWLSKKIEPLIDDNTPAYYSASFSPGGGYYVLSYEGPDVPYEEVYATESATWPIRTIEDNKVFYENFAKYKLPKVSYFSLQHPDGFTLNVRRQLPTNFNSKKRYPVLFTPYGGPNSQSVSKKFQPYDWKTYIGSHPELQYIVYTIDGRGTGFQGRAYRSSITSQLGKLESADQTWAARTLRAQFKYINPHKIGMWGWSYGGYLTAKTLEADSGVFSFGLITAPVTDWRFYDSVYAERYMKTLDSNNLGYTNAAVHNVDGFEKVAGGFSIIHGTGDENVHYQHTAALLDLLVGGSVSPKKMKLLVFTDGGHNMDYNGGRLFLYRFLTERLYDEVKRKGGKKPVVYPWTAWNSQRKVNLW
ncbi:dipeptidyl peptidase IV N-terminal region-domain-containing protein [Mariannaea sp. PMI_226]|nr:dipeptidyl peptidase IV N-terminal region-domain-containing protein [Mariannaea sp. PMI_226]